MRLAAQERRREGNEPQTTKVAHHAAYPRHEGFEVEIQDEDADAVGTSPESSEVVEFGVMPAVSRLQPSDVGLDGVGGAAGGVSGGQGMEVEVMRMRINQWLTGIGLVILLASTMWTLFLITINVLAFFESYDITPWYELRSTTSVSLAISVMGLVLAGIASEIYKLRIEVTDLSNQVVILVEELLKRQAGKVGDVLNGNVSGEANA